MTAAGPRDKASPAQTNYDYWLSILSGVTEGGRTLGSFVPPEPNIVPLPYQDGSNLYVYATNNPVAYTDPSGEISRTKLEAFIRIYMMAWKLLTGEHLT